MESTDWQDYATITYCGYWIQIQKEFGEDNYRGTANISVFYIFKTKGSSVKEIEDNFKEAVDNYINKNFNPIRGVHLDNVETMLNEKNKRIAELEEEVALLKLKLQRKIEIIKVETYRLEK